MKKLIIFATLIMIMTGCGQKKQTKLYNPQHKNSSICFDKDANYIKQVTPEGERYTITGISSADITSKTVFLETCKRYHAGAGEWDGESTILVATGYDSLNVEFYSPADEKSYCQGGTVFYGPYTITMWFGNREVSLEVS